MTSHCYITLIPTEEDEELRHKNVEKTKNREKTKTEKNLRAQTPRSEAEVKRRKKREKWGILDPTGESRSRVIIIYVDSRVHTLSSNKTTNFIHHHYQSLLTVLLLS